MRNAVIIIHRAIERIDHPLKFARLIADDSFFAVECVLRKFFEQRLRDQFLRADIDFEFDVVLGGLIHPLGFSKSCRSISPAAQAALTAASR